MSHRHQPGFTLIELMIVTVLIGVLVAIAVPGFISMRDRERDNTVKANMHTLQLAAEDYGVQNDGTYASDYRLVRELLPAGGVNFKNPVTGQRDSLNTGLPGSCFYQDSAGMKYTIGGYDHTGRQMSLVLTSGY